MYHSQTQITRLGLAAGPSMHNRKPYRNAKLKAEARKTATKRDDGAWRSTTMTLLHDAPKGTPK